MLVYAQLNYTAAAQAVDYHPIIDCAYDERKVQKELKEINRKYPYPASKMAAPAGWYNPNQHVFFKAVQYSKWHNAAEYLLAERIVDIDALDGGSTFLDMGLAAGDEKIIKWLLDHDADIDRRGSCGNTVLIEACKGYYDRSPICYPEPYPKNYCSIIKLLLERGAQVDRQGMEGKTALMQAISNLGWGRRSKEVVRMLLRAGADPHLKNMYGKSVVTSLADRYCDGDLVVRFDAEAKSRDGEYKLRANLALKSMLVANCRLDEVTLADIITGYVGDVVPPLDWEIGMPVIKQPKKESGCVIS